MDLRVSISIVHCDDVIRANFRSRFGEANTQGTGSGKQERHSTRQRLLEIVLVVGDFADQITDPVE